MAPHPMMPLTSADFLKTINKTRITAMGSRVNNNEPIDIVLSFNK